MARPLTENTAILPYLGKRFGYGRRIRRPRRKALSLIGFFASSVHPGARPCRPARALYRRYHCISRHQGDGSEDLSRLPEADRRHAGGTRMVLDSYSVLDPYGFVFYTWGVRRELPMAELKNYTAHKDRLLKREAVG
jgi:glutathione S-transferase